jgi:uncharacterized membrane protein YphA (DoxX/SURF4 family)
LIAELAAKKNSPCIEDFLDVIDLIDAYARSHPYRSSHAIPLRLIVGFGFMEHGYAKIARGPENYASILQAVGVPPTCWLG